VDVQPFLAGHERMLLDLDPPVAAIPWDLLDAGSAAVGCDRRPWAARAAASRGVSHAGRGRTPRAPTIGACSASSSCALKAVRGAAG
jgi:hypothetical protein